MTIVYVYNKDIRGSLVLHEFQLRDQAKVNTIMEPVHNMCPMPLGLKKSLSHGYTSKSS